MSSARQSAGFLIGAMTLILACWLLWTKSGQAVPFELGAEDSQLIQPLAEQEQSEILSAAVPSDTRSVETGREEVQNETSAGTVIVVDEQERPIAGAQVAVEVPGQRQPVCRVESDASGQALLRAPVVATFDVAVQARGFVPTGLAYVPYGTTTKVTLSAAAQLECTILTAQGELLAGGTAQLLGPARGREKHGFVAEVVAGKFELDRVRPGNYDLLIQPKSPHDSVRTHTVPGLHLAAGTNQKDIRLPAGRRLTGRVVESLSGRPIEAAEVSLQITPLGGHGAFTVQTKSDLAGGFCMENLPVGEGTLTADTPAHSAQHRNVKLELPGGEQREDIALPGVARLRGIVLTADGTPVPEADVTYGWGREGGLSFGDRTKSDANGQFELTVPVRDAALLAATKAGLPAGGEWIGRVSAGEQRHDITIRLKKGSELRVRVIDERRAPCVNAKVELVPKHGADRFATVATTDAFGQVVFAQVTEFDYQLRVTADGFLRHSHDLKVTANQPASELPEIVLRPAYTIHGLVFLRGTGVGLSAVRVRATPLDRRDDPTGRAITDLYGAFEIGDLAAGRYALHLWGPDLVDMPATTVVLPSNEPVKFYGTRRVAAAQGAIIGRVLDAGTTRPVRGLRISGVEPRTIALVGCAFRIAPVSVGWIELKLAAPGCQPRVVPVIVRGEELTDLETLWLQPAGSITLTVKNSAGKALVANRVKIRCVDREGASLREVLTPQVANARNSVFKFEGLALSKFEITVEYPGLQTQVLAVDLSSEAHAVRELRLSKR